MVIYIRCFYLILSIIYCQHSVSTTYLGCSPLHSEFDILFILDSTLDVGIENHKAILELLANFTVEMKMIGEENPFNMNKLALAQFTPELKLEFGFNQLSNEISKINGMAEEENVDELIRRRILSVPYSPCIICPHVSLNTIVRRIFNGPDSRQSVAKLVILVTTPLARPLELNPGEILVQPLAPIHFYVITVGEDVPANLRDKYSPLEFAATTAHLGSSQFADLPDLLSPLCQSVHSFLGDGKQDGTTEGPLPASFCFIFLVLLALCSILLIGLLCWLGEKYRNEGIHYRNLMKNEQEKLRKLEDYYQQKLIDDQRREEEYHAQMERTFSELPIGHPSTKLVPVNLLLLVDGSGSMGKATFEQVKVFLQHFVGNIDVAPGRSKIACVIFATDPFVYFDLNRFYTIASVQDALGRMPLLGGGTRLAKALTFASGMLSREQTLKDFGDEHHLHTLQTPRINRLQVIILISDGLSDDNFDQQAAILNERLHIKIAAVVTKKFYRERLLPIVRYDDAIFTLAQIEALSNWLWNQQEMWNEKVSSFVEWEKSFLTTSKKLRNAVVKEKKIKSNSSQNQVKDIKGISNKEDETGGNDLEK